MIPKLSQPLTKAIRTTEGLLISAITVFEFVYSSIDPHRLSTKEAGILAAIQSGALVAQRMVIKAVALTKGGAQPYDVEALASNVAGKIGLTLPSSAEFKQIINDAITEANVVTHTQPQVPLPGSTPAG